jgi:hypothetical protein
MGLARLWPSQENDATELKKSQRRTRVRR